MTGGGIAETLRGARGGPHPTNRRFRLRRSPFAPALLLALAGFGCQAVAAAQSATAAPLYWSGAIPVDTGSAPAGDFRDISCASTSLCVAVDRAGNVVSTTDPAGGGGEWAVAHIEGAGGEEGGRISCASTPICVAIVSRGSIMASTHPTGGPGAWAIAAIDGAKVLRGVSCTSPSLCVAVDERGNVLTASNPTGGPGAWTIADIDGEVAINDVSCASPSLCVAVDEGGNVLTSTNPEGGAGAWTKTHVADAGLSHVSCMAAPLCVATGNRAILSSPDPTGGSASWKTAEGVDASGEVSCASASLCAAFPGDTNGELLASANPAGGAPTWVGDGVGFRWLTGISCPSASRCVAVDPHGDVFIATQAHRLSLSLQGTAGGAITGAPISCPFSTCASHSVPGLMEPLPLTEAYCSDVFGLARPPLGTCGLDYPQGDQVDVTAAPVPGAVLAGWSGACTGSGSCVVSMSADRAVAATFVPVPTPLATVARITALRETNAVFAVAGSSTPLTGRAARRRARGTVFSFQLDQPATVKVAIRATVAGRRVGRECKPRSRALRRRPSCRRPITLDTFTRTGHAALNKIAFSGRMGKRALKKGHYRAVLSTTDAAGSSAAHALAFTIVGR